MIYFTGIFDMKHYHDDQSTTKSTQKYSKVLLIVKVFYLMFAMCVFVSKSDTMRQFVAEKENKLELHPPSERILDLWWELLPDRAEEEEAR